MANYDDALLEASDHLLTRSAGRRGKLPAARVRRSISALCLLILMRGQLRRD